MWVRQHGKSAAVSQGNVNELSSIWRVVILLVTVWVDR